MIMKASKLLKTAGAVVLLLFAQGCKQSESPVPSPVPTVTSTIMPTAMPTASVSPSVMPSVIPLPTDTPLPTAKPQTANTNKPEPVQEADEEMECMLRISCDTILNNIELLNENKRQLIPSGGVIFNKSVVFYEGESVFNLLRRETRKNQIHMEFASTPIYGSTYIEGINNIYEYDCGELSGWMYRVNGDFPNYSSSEYLLHEGDVVEWVYTCNLGKDVGGDYYAQVGE